ncbi:hypothetical protein GCM10023091_13550 [Ravibacter arvi]|uniref:Uncharacterized protein n=1 Tax=Ravibacter arvi TaxID=2051041 RepID=A0ABP8LUY9_9BACT
MKRKICVIDDSLPTSDYPDFIDETQLLHQSILKYLCHQHESWPEEPLRGLLLEIFKNHNNWTISGFLNPDFYFNHVGEEIYSPEVIIFDWDYATTSVGTEEHLLNILQSTYSVVGIYTGADKKDEIESILAQQKFTPYMESRIRMVEKGDIDSVSKILTEVNLRFDSHFSFKLGQELKFNAVKALDSILVDIGEMSFDEFIWTFGHERDENERSISINEFIEILSEKFRNNLANAHWSETTFESSAPAKVTEELVRKLWSYRLYKFPNDDLVRVGDIISKVGDNNDEKFLVISSDCHMSQLWKKNFGSLTLIPLFANTKTSRSFIDKLLTAQKRGYIRQAKASSITNLSAFDSLTLITSIPSKDAEGKAEFIDYVAFPRSVFSIDVPKPAKLEEHQVRLQALHYSHIEGYTGKGRLSLNEPFRSPLIQYCVNAVTGYGAPDYPDELQTSIQKRFDGNFTA